MAILVVAKTFIPVEVITGILEPTTMGVEIDLELEQAIIHPFPLTDHL